MYLLVAENMGGLYKIGRTHTTMKRRLMRITVCSPVPISEVHHVESADPVVTERQLHEEFAPHREHGEWFRFCSGCVQGVVTRMDELAS